MAKKPKKDAPRQAPELPPPQEQMLSLRNAVDLIIKHLNGEVLTDELREQIALCVENCRLNDHAKIKIEQILSKNFVSKDKHQDRIKKQTKK